MTGGSAAILVLMFILVLVVAVFAVGAFILIKFSNWIVPMSIAGWAFKKFKQNGTKKKTKKK